MRVVRCSVVKIKRFENASISSKRAKIPLMLAKEANEQTNNNILFCN